MANRETTSTDGAALSLKEASELRATSIEEIWDIVKRSSMRKNVEPLKNRKGWKVVRIFVSSTFKDFHQEREVLIKEVFPELKVWCHSKKIQIVECDLRWGVPKGTEGKETINICLSELDRCYRENEMPFFLNMVGNRAGWVPFTEEEVPKDLAELYGWVFGLSVTEMEIIHGAFRIMNPNALFMIRQIEDPQNIPEAKKGGYFEESLFSDHLQKKLEALKENIISTFPESNVKKYSVTCETANSNEVHLNGLNGATSDFYNTVLKFFKQRIEDFYPLDPTPLDPEEIQKDAHQMVLNYHSLVIGRNTEYIEKCIINGYRNAPVMITGHEGCGKSAFMAETIRKTIELASSSTIIMPNTKNQCRVFYHFVGATSQSTNMVSFLQRLLKAIKPDMLEMPYEVEVLIHQVHKLISAPKSGGKTVPKTEDANNTDDKTQSETSPIVDAKENEAARNNTEADANDEMTRTVDPIVIFVDAINQLEVRKEKHSYRWAWLPAELSSNVRVVISTTEGSFSHRAIFGRKPPPTEFLLNDLIYAKRVPVIKAILKVYNKRLAYDQYDLLTKNRASGNPLWLMLACEELRVHGKYETVNEKIESLPGYLEGLVQSFFERFESGTCGELIKACLCLLYVSRNGLLENELREILGNHKNVEVPKYDKERENVTSENDQIKSSDKEFEENLQEASEPHGLKGEADNKGKEKSMLPAHEWAIIYGSIKPFLRPYDELGEGRLVFYYQSVKKAIAGKYFNSCDDIFEEFQYKFWRGVIVDYFEAGSDLDRKTEEMLFQLDQLKDVKRLITYLTDWEIFNRIYSAEYSHDLLHLWDQCGGSSLAASLYDERLVDLRKSLPPSDYVGQVKKVYRFLMQAGQYNAAMKVLRLRSEIEIQWELLQQKEDITDKELDDLASLRFDNALCLSEISKTTRTLNEAHTINYQKIVDLCTNSLLMRQRMKQGSPENEYKIGCIKILLAHHLCNVADLKQRANDLKKAGKNRKEASTHIRDAYKIFAKFDDFIRIAECCLIQAFVNETQSADKMEKALRVAFRKCNQACGERGWLFSRISLNYVRLYRMKGQSARAEEMLLKIRKFCLDFMGPEHPKTKLVENLINDPLPKDTPMLRM